MILDQSILLFSPRNHSLRLFELDVVIFVPEFIKSLPNSFPSRFIDRDRDLFNAFAIAQDDNSSGVLWPIRHAIAE